jgi:hypothetical protein
MDSPFGWMAAASLALVTGFILIRRYRNTRVSQPMPLRPPADRLITDSVSTGEGRRSPRRWGDPVQVLITEVNRSVEPLPGWTINRSVGGLGLSLPEAIPNGTVIKVRVAVAPDSIPWTDMVVCGCNALAGRWILNCQFVSPPPDEVRLLFR